MVVYSFILVCEDMVLNGSVYIIHESRLNN